jgi:hypothetical protein
VLLISIREITDISGGFSLYLNANYGTVTEIRPLTLHFTKSLENYSLIIHIIEAGLKRASVKIK